MRFKITNTTDQTDDGARNVFVIEAGKLLAPGQSAPCNRIEKGTRSLAEQGALKIEEGDFEKPAPVPEKKKEEKPAPPKAEAPPPKKKAEPAPAPAPAPAPKPEPVDDKKKDEQSGKKSSGD